MPRTSSAALTQTKFTRLFYQYAYLRARRSMASLEDEETAQFVALGALLENGDCDPRAHRRQPAKVPVLLKVEGRLVSATVLNVSGGGLLVSTPVSLKVGSQVRATFGTKGQTQYIFSCEVVRRDGAGCGLRFVGIPLEIRYGSYAPTSSLLSAA